MTIRGIFMKTTFSAARTFLNDEDAVTSIEYALIAALVGIGVAVAAKALGGGISAAFDNIVSRLANALA